MRVFLDKLKQVSLGASPIIVLISIVNIVSPMPKTVWVPFLISIFLLVLGQAAFLVGVDSSILTMGELVGSKINKLKKMWIILLFAFLFGTMATYAEPAVGVLSDLVHKVNPKINSQLIMWIVSCGIGVFVAYALLRIYRQFSIKISFAISYAVVFLLIILMVILDKQEFIAIAFDFSGATTGVITVPFILALGVGVTAVLGRKDQSDSYGLIGLASVGPIITMCIMGLCFSKSGATDITAQQIVGSSNFGESLLSSFTGILIALAPITIVFFIFNFMFIKLPKHKIIRTLVGVLVTILGLTMFLTAVNFGFKSAGTHLGAAFTNASARLSWARGDWFKYLLIPFGFILGFAITYTEVAIRVLANQVEDNTHGTIKRNTLMLTLALGLGLTVTFGMVRILWQVNILWFIIPMLLIGLAIMPVVPKMFTGLAFDSGGVASGTITAAFTIPFAIGAVDGLRGTTANYLIEGFGMIAFIAVIPILAISVLGLVYQRQIAKATAQKIAPVTATNFIIGIVARPNMEEKIAHALQEFNAQPLTTLNAKGLTKAHEASVFHLLDETKSFILGLISKDNAEKMIAMLETDYGFREDDRSIGIAFAIPVDSIRV